MTSFFGRTLLDAETMIQDFPDGIYIDLDRFCPMPLSHSRPDWKSLWALSGCSSDGWGGAVSQVSG